jgi:lipoprotein-releasing system permease protein
LNYELFIAKRIIASKQDKNSISKPIIKIAITAIALGMIVMMVSVATSFGLQEKIKEKIAGFNGHITITSFGKNNSEITLQPVSTIQDFYPDYSNFHGVKKIQAYATKAGIIRTATDFEGVLVKGVEKNYDWSFYQEYIEEGRIPEFGQELSNEILISREIANKMNLTLQDACKVFFIKNELDKLPWVRVLKIAGIYNTGFQEFDEKIMVADLRHLQKMNRWEVDEVGGFEIMLNNFNGVDEKTKAIYQDTPSNLNTENIIEKNPIIFEWMKLFDNNIYLIIGIMILVAGINMITALLVLIIEKTKMIGLLKTLGCQHKSIVKIFLINASYIIAKGLFWGNLIGIGLLMIQKKFEIIRLDPESYYVSSVSVVLNPSLILLLNVGTLLLCLLMLLLPSAIISKINPTSALKFD